MKSATRDEWNEFFELYRELARRVAMGLLGDADAAEDVVQEASRALIEHTHSRVEFESRAHARNWFLRCVKNIAVSGLRARGRSRQSRIADETLRDARAADPANQAGAREATDTLGVMLDEALGELSQAEREALLMRYREGLAYRTIAERTGKAISTLQARVEAGLRKLRIRIGKNLDGANPMGEDT